MVRQTSKLTLGDIFYTLPWRVCKAQTPERYFDIWMLSLDSLEVFDRLSEGENDEQMLRLGAAAHGDSRSQRSEA